MKPILFNTDMVRAILDGRKTVTRRAIKPLRGSLNRGLRPFCVPDDILYVRETTYYDAYAAFTQQTFYKADYESKPNWVARTVPAIHMPREAARIFLRVTNVWVERLQEIKNDECVDEGAVAHPDYTKSHDLVLHKRYRREFALLWDSTIKPADLDRYGWSANPWVWVIEFERCEKPKEET